MTVNLNLKREFTTGISVVDHHHHTITCRTGERLRLLVVSDIRLYREVLERELLSSDVVEVVGTASLDDVSRLVGELGPDVVVLDSSRSDSVALVRELKVARPDLRIVVVTSGRDDVEILAWADIGMNGYVDRNGSVADLAAAVQHAGRGEVLCSPRVTALLARRVSKLSAERKKPSELDSLTPRERDVLALIAEGLSNKDIAQQLLISPTTAKNHVQNVLDKLDARSRNLAAAFYVKLGGVK